MNVEEYRAGVKALRSKLWNVGRDRRLRLEAVEAHKARIDEVLGPWMPLRTDVAVSYGEGDEVVEVLKPPLSAHAVLRRVSNDTGVTVAEMQSHSRAKRISRARQKAMYEIREECKWSYPRIAKLLGGRDHTTVIHGVKAHAARLEPD